MTAHAIGIDFGGTGIKAAPVDLESGDLVEDRHRIDTPKPSTPEAVGDIMAELCDSFPDSTGPVGVAVPAVVRRGVVLSAANIDKSWIGVDADAAGHAEMQYGAAKGRDGLVIVTTLGTGIGSALLWNGVLVPNSELGHLEIDGHDAEKRAATSAREREGLSWEEWAKRLTIYYRTLEKLFCPELFVVGGGVSKKADKFLPLIEIETEIIVAKLKNNAGIVGAGAMSGEE